MTGASPAVEIEALTRSYGSVKALDQINLTVHAGEFFSLLGPSGCGKTTLLRLLAGLDTPDSGTVRLGGTDVTAVPAHRRPVNTVFQSYALFPHLNVWDNVAFGLRMKRLPRAEIEPRVRRGLELVEIGPLAQRKPQQLSGGQKQRVALARALVNEPQVLLLDEPLGALDLRLRRQLQVELRQLQQRLGITFIHVTHDQDEAFALSDRIAVMCEGRIAQMGDGPSLYERPRSRFVSQFLGTCSLIEATIRSRDGAAARVETAVGELEVAAMPAGRDRVTLAIRPEKIQLLPRIEETGVNRVRVRIEGAVYAGAGTHYELAAGAQRLVAKVINTHTRCGEFATGLEVFAYLPPDALVVLED